MAGLHTADTCLDYDFVQLQTLLDMYFTMDWKCMTSSREACDAKKQDTDM